MYLLASTISASHLNKVKSCLEISWAGGFTARLLMGSAISGDELIFFGFKKWALSGIVHAVDWARHVII